jgi:triosephosphate isomerase (TIM)
MSQPMIVGNWKLNPGTSSEAKKLFQDVKNAVIKLKPRAVVAVAPPTIFIPEVSKGLKTDLIGLAAQDAHFEERGACTGQVSATLLQPYGVQYVLVGHSEKRALGETDEQVNKKVQALLKRRLIPIVCIGERERDAAGSFYSIIEKQLRSLVLGLTPIQISRCVIAYEPIWAIGTGATATPEDVKEMQLFIMSTLTKLYDRKVAGKVALLYGGSVKASNAKDLHEAGGMNGFLVGGASLEAGEFTQIIKATQSK